VSGIFSASIQPTEEFLMRHFETYRPAFDVFIKKAYADYLVWHKQNPYPPNAPRPPWEFPHYSSSNANKLKEKMREKAREPCIPVSFGLPSQQRMEHHWIVAAPGSGKTQMLQAMIADDIEHGRTVFVMDSQRDMIHKLVHMKHGMETILIDPEDTEYPPAIALFDMKTGDETEENTIIELYAYVFSSLIEAALTSRQDVLFTYVLRLMFKIKDANIFTLLDVFKNGENYQREMGQLDPVESDFFRDEFFAKHYAANKQQIVQRLHGILKNKTFRRIFANTKSKINFAQLINKPCVILVNTSKAHLGGEGSAIFGRFILTLLTMAIYQRARIPEEKRRQIFLYIDEGGDYGNDKAFINIISQCRKYKAGLIFCNQYLRQLSDEVLGAMMACAIKCVSNLEDPTETKKMASSLRVDPGFIQSLRKDATGAEWALYVRGRQTIGARVPFGILEAKEKRADYVAFRHENRATYCALPAPTVEVRTTTKAGKLRIYHVPISDESFFD
jgi:type IV secretion system coupling TraD/TrwB family protein